MKLKKIQMLLILILIILMPLHYVVFSCVLGDVKVLSLWRDVAIISLFLTTIENKKIKVDKIGKLILGISLMVSIFCISNLNGTSLNVARTYIVPMLVYIPLRRIDFTAKDINKILSVFWVTAVCVSMYAIFQAYVLGTGFLINLGYASLNGRLASSSFYIAGNWMQQRICGTFVSPNTCGAYLAICIISLLGLKQYCRINKKVYYIGVGIMGLALLGTLSRSAWVGTIMGLVFVYWRNLLKVKPKTMLLAIVAVATVFLTDYFALDGKILNIVISQIINTASGTDSSMQLHIKHLYEPMIEVVSHPLGYKFGTNGSFALTAYSRPEVHLVESSIYLLCYEFGLIGALFFLSPYFLCFKGVKSKEATAYRVDDAISILLLIVYCLLPSIQSYEQSFYFYFFSALIVCIKNYNKISG